MTVLYTWWGHEMETFSTLLAICAGNSPVPGEFPAQRPVTQSFDVYFDLRPNKRLSKQTWGWWSETPPRPLWRHCNDVWSPQWLQMWGSLGCHVSNRRIVSPMWDIFPHIFLNTSWLRHNGRHFPDIIFKCIFLNENVWILIMISLKFVPNGPINNIPALVQIMVRHRIGDKPLSEPKVTQFHDAYIYIYVGHLAPQWVNLLWARDSMWWQRSRSTLVQIMAGGTKLLL